MSASGKTIQLGASDFGKTHEGCFNLTGRAVFTPALHTRLVSLTETQPRRSNLTFARDERTLKSATERAWKPEMRRTSYS